MNHTDEPVGAQANPEEHAGPHRDRLTILRCVILTLAVIGSFANVWMANENRKLLQRLKVAVAQAEHQTPQQPEDLSEYGVIHMPASGQCPAGFEVARDIFERDGRKYAGCSRVGADPNRGAVDRLDPGESFLLRIPIDPPRRPDLPSVRQ